MNHTWALVLAAGEGSRLRTLTTTHNGVAVPKQFCSLLGGPSLLQEALQRAETIAPRSRICTIVAAQHRRWWEGPLGSLPPRNVIVQPQNRGTAAGLLLPMLHIAARDPRARVVVLPSDHHVRDELILGRSLRQAVAMVEMRRVARDDLAEPRKAIATAELYARVPELDFSRHVLEGAQEWLRLMPVPPCGWSDLGTPKRVAEALRHLAEEELVTRPTGPSASLNLAVQHARLQMAI
jgi:mannose-1-phosphate guanylyltransferase